MQRKFLRYKELKERGVVRNYPGVERARKQLNFPAPYRLGINTVAWAEDEIDAWLDSQREEPTTQKWEPPLCP